MFCWMWWCVAGFMFPDNLNGGNKSKLIGFLVITVWHVLSLQMNAQ